MIFAYVRMVYFLSVCCNCISTCVMNLSAAGISIFPSTSASSIINDNDVCEILLTVGINRLTFQNVKKCRYDYTTKKSPYFVIIEFRSDI
jgi:hypothetical protein